MFHYYLISALDKIKAIDCVIIQDFHSLIPTRGQKTSARFPHESTHYTRKLLVVGFQTQIDRFFESSTLL